MQQRILTAVVAVSSAIGIAAAAPAGATTPGSGSAHVKVFIGGAHESADQSVVTLPLHHGSSGGAPVYYVILDASTPAAAAALGVNYVPKLRNARGTAAVQRVRYTTLHDGLIFPATVDFSPRHVLTPGPTGFPPSAAKPGAVARAGYTPLVELPDGTVLDAPQVANASGRADKVTRLDIARRSVTYRETEGRYDNRVVHYVSFESSDPAAAAIEDVTYAPALNAAPAPGDESDRSAREALIAFTNGQTGRHNPQRQGFSSALLDGLSPLNILHEVPERGNTAYSPIWDVHFATWTAAAIAAGDNVRQSDFAAVLRLVRQGRVTGFGGAPFGPNGFVVTCPVISENFSR